MFLGFSFGRPISELAAASQRRLASSRWLSRRPCPSPRARSHPSVLLIGQFTVCGIGTPDSQQAPSSICAYLPCRENSTDTCPGTSALIVGPALVTWPPSPFPLVVEGRDPPRPSMFPSPRFLHPGCTASGPPEVTPKRLSLLYLYLPPYLPTYIHHTTHTHRPHATCYMQHATCHLSPVPACGSSVPCVASSCSLRLLHRLLFLVILLSLKPGSHGETRSPGCLVRSPHCAIR